MIALAIKETIHLFIVFPFVPLRLQLHRFESDCASLSVVAIRLAARAERRSLAAVRSPQACGLFGLTFFLRFGWSFSTGLVEISRYMRSCEAEIFRLGPSRTETIQCTVHAGDRRTDTRLRYPVVVRFVSVQIAGLALRFN